MEKLKVFIAEGKSREEIAELLNVTVNSLQVTCSRLGISLRRRQKKLRSHALDRRRRNIPASNSVGAHALGQNLDIGAHIAPWAHFTMTMRRGSGETVADIPLTPGAIHNLALNAMRQNLGIAELIGQLLITAIEKDLVREVLGDDVGLTNRH